MNVSTRTQILLLASTTFVAGANEYILAGILDLVSKGLHTPVAATGQLITIYALVYGLCVPIVVAMTSHYGRRSILTVSMTAYAVVSSLCFFVDGFWWFAALRVLQALAGGMAVVSALSTATTIAGPERRGRAIATVMMGFTLSLIVAVPAGREIALHFGWNAVFLAVGVLAFATALGQRLALPKLDPAATIPLRRQAAILKRPEVAGGLLVTVLWMVGYVVTYSYLTPYLIHVQHVAVGWVSPLLLAFGIASLIGTRAGGSHTDRHGHHATLVRAKALMMLALIAMALAALLLPHGPLAAIAGILIVWSIAAWACGPSHQVRMASLDPAASGVLVGLNQSGMQIGIALGSALGGLVAATSSLAALPWVSSAVIAAALAIMVILHRGRRRVFRTAGA